MIHVFLLLLFAHVLGDFVFQTNNIYRLKVNYFGGVILHSAIFYMLAILITLPLSVSNTTYAIWLFFVFVSHIFVDKVKLLIGKTVIAQEYINFIIDQCIHIAVLTSLLFLPITIQPSSLLVEVLHQTGLSSVSLSLIFFSASMLIFVTYSVSVLLYYYDCSVHKEQKPLKYNYNRMLYRAVLYLLLIGQYFPVGIVLIIANYVYSKKILAYDMKRFIIEKAYILLLLVIYVLVKGVLI